MTSQARFYYMLSGVHMETVQFDANLENMQSTVIHPGWDTDLKILEHKY